MRVSTAFIGSSTEILQIYHLEKLTNIRVFLVCSIFTLKRINSMIGFISSSLNVRTKFCTSNLNIKCKEINAASLNFLSFYFSSHFLPIDQY